MALLLRNRTVATLTEDERDKLERAVAERRRLAPRTTLVDRGEALGQSTMLVEGFMIRYIDDPDVNRQIVAFHVPGDFVDLHGFPLHVLDHSIGTLTHVVCATVPHTTLKTLTDQDPALARKLWGSTLLDAAMHREWLFRLGRLDGVGRVAHFLAETNARLEAIGLGDGRTFRLPITQTDIAEITGLTGIHVNRVLRTMREEGICTFRSSMVEIADLRRLENIARFDPTYLYLTTRSPAMRVSQASEKEIADG